jgi:hypothetical protein
MAAVKEFWKFTEVAEFLPIAKAQEKANADEQYLVIKLGTIVSRSLPMGHRGAKESYKQKTGSDTGFDDNPWRNVSSGQIIEITGKKDRLAWVYIPMYSKENYITKEILYYGVAALHSLTETMDKTPLKTNWKLISTYNDSKPKDIKTKTLLLADVWLDEKVKPEDIKKIYPGKVEVVSYDTWKEAILSRNSEFTYSIVVPVPSGGDYNFEHHLMDASKGTFSGIAAPKVAVKMNSPLGRNVNLTKANTGYINKTMLEMYRDLYNK